VSKIDVFALGLYLLTAPGTMINMYIKFEVSSLSRSRAILGRL